MQMMLYNILYVYISVLFILLKLQFVRLYMLLLKIVFNVPQFFLFYNHFYYSFYGSPNQVGLQVFL